MKHIIILMLYAFPVFCISQGMPNIVFVMADDIGNGDMSRNDATFATPTMDSLAANGAYFSNFYARPVCTPARYGLMTGIYPFRKNGNFDLFVNFPYEEYGLDDEKTLPEYLKEKGYVTSAWGKWHLGITPESLPTNQGFDLYNGGLPGFQSMKPVDDYASLGVPAWSQNGEKYTPSTFTDSTFSTDIQALLVADWIATQAQDTTAPFFAYVNPINPHADNAAAPDTIPYKQVDYAASPYTSTKGHRWANLKNWDDMLATIWGQVRASGIENNTIIIVTSDNGGRTDVEGRNTPYSGTKATLQEGGVRVPFLWYHSGVVDSIVIDSVTCLEDVLPTIVEGVLGGVVADTVDGINFYPLISGVGGFPANRVWHGPYIPNRCWSIVRGKWKLVNNKTASVISASSLSNNIQLYDLETDITETTDVSGSNASVATELQALHDALPVPTNRTVIASPQPGWVDPDFWGQIPYYYSSNYIFQRADYKR